MDSTAAFYLVYVAASVALTVWVGRTLFRHGWVFLVDVFAGNEPLAAAVNRLLLIGFYLVNFGFISFWLKTRDPIHDFAEGIEVLSYKIGVVLVVLGALHFFNLYVFAKIRSQAPRNRITPNPPAGPHGAAVRPGGSIR